MQVRVNASISDIEPSDWDSLAGSRYPFLSHAFLKAAEDTGCVSAETGWQPRHLTLEDDDGDVLGAMLLYEKSHSWGEFVFDWAWASAYHRAGFPYYPKLVSAVPFTPAPCPKLLLRDDADPELARVLVDAGVTLARETDCSSFHVLFPVADELPVLESAGLKIRKDCQFHWHNRSYSDFDDFLSTFNARKRKKARRDRRHVEESGIRFRHLHGEDMDPALWEHVYRLINLTFMRRGSTHYFDLDFFLRVSRAMPGQVLVVLAEAGDDDIVAAAVFFESAEALYGRYWGSTGNYNALHFETCYYQGIDYCIKNGIKLFEPGTQGEHKVSRGFIPESTWSAHWLAHPEFFAAISDYLELEIDDVERYMQSVDERSPYRRPAE
ncbi:MAG: GNAT family N-acetyltransferase [Woeseiaceae bacterium]|nr:GNAT family N-acetyltransferase [Woeseiaceae bacterium]